MTITEFLLARIEEDERLAREWSRPGFVDNPPSKVYDDVYSMDLNGWYPVGTSGSWSDGQGNITENPDMELAYGIGEDSRIPRAAVQHISNWQPVRVLAECAGKRAIVEAYEAECQIIGGGDWFDGARAGRLLSIRALVAVYADHPDFDPAWVL